MGRLQQSRQVRTTTENLAALIIQSQYRGHLVRSKLEDISQRFEIHRKIRAFVAGYLEQNNIDLIVRLKDHRLKYTNTRFNGASTIQRTFRCWLSRRTFRCRVQEMLLRRKNKAILAIQCWSRCHFARQKVRLLRLRNISRERNKGALRIQTCARRLSAIRYVRKLQFKLRWVAACIIQRAYRVRHSKWRVSILKEMFRNIRELKGARAMQKIVRAFIARRRILRIRLRKVHGLLFHFLSRIQRIVRGFLGRIRAKRFKHIIEERRLKMESEAQKAAQVRKIDINIDRLVGLSNMIFCKNIECFL